MKKLYTISLRALAFLFALMISVSAFAQAKITVTGTVLDETGMPMIGVGVVEQGNVSNGAVTDLDGNYSITVPQTAVIVFSYISYATQNISVAGQSVINVNMAPDQNVLDEVVVVGYGTMKRSDLTGSVASVSSKAIESFKTGSVVEALGGQIAGVNITASDGTPGGGFDVKIRGVGTVNGESAPLYIVDGFEVANIDYLANQDIASIDVLKDASAAAIYGARAANGVVLVTTKSGKEGKPVLSYNGSASYRMLSKRLELLSPKEFVALQVEAFPSKYGTTYYRAGEDEDGVPYKYQSLDDYDNVAGVDWQDEAFHPTWSQNHEVSLMGGTKDTQYTVSYTHFDENGIYKNSSFAKDTARMKFRQKITKWLTFDATVSYTHTKKTGVGTGGSTLANLLRYRPTGGLKVSDWSLRHELYDPLSLEQSNFNSNNSNPLLGAESTDDINKSNQWVANGSLTFQIIKGLTFKTSGTYNATYSRRDLFYNTGTSQAYRTGSPYGQSQMTNNLRWQNSNVLTYKTTVAKKHNIEAMVGHEVASQSSEWLLGQAQDFPTEVLGNDNLGMGGKPTRVSSSKTGNMRLSFFARGMYNYADRYMLTATVRADASSVFSAKHKWGCFPSVAAAWNLAKEPWLSNVDWLNTLKIRAGWGTVGNDRISSFLSLDLYSQGKWGNGSSQETVFYPKQLPNPDLKWEGSTTTNLGLDFGFFDSRLTLTADGFIKDTKDLLMAKNMAYVSGFGSQWQNVGKIRNMGIELTLSGIIFNTRNFFWKSDLNISFLKNTLVELADGNKYYPSNTGFNSNFKSYDYMSYVGRPLGDMYGYIEEGVYQISDFMVTPSGERILKPGIPDISEHAGRKVEPGMSKYKDIDGDGIITTDDRTVIGNGQPVGYGGFTNTFNFYGVDLSFMFQFSWGNDVYNATRLYATQSQDERSNMLKEVADRWTTTNASNKVPAWNGYIKADVTSRFIEDGSFFRLKNITLGYTLPEKLTRKFYVSKLRVYATAQNLFCLTKYSGYDPEVNMKSSPLMPSFDWGAYPKSKVITVGLELQF